METDGRGRASRAGTRPARSRPPGARRRRALWWLLPLLAVFFVPLAPTARATAAAPAETGKYYVVGPPVNGQREYLYSIALLTLGNGNRFREIIDLNRGRKQPDGATFTDGVELAPGWILVLPRDADGPGVRTGALPAIGPPTPRPSPSTAAPSPSKTAASPSTPPAPSATTSQPPPSAAPAESPAVAGPPSRSEPSVLGRLSADQVRVGAAVLAVALAVVAILVLPRRVRQMRSVTLDDGPWPPERHHTPTPAELDAVAVATRPDARPGPGTSAAAPGLAESEAEQTAERGLPDLRTAEHAQLRLAKPAPVSVPSAPPPEWPPLVGVVPTHASTGRSAGPEPAGAADGVGRAGVAVLPRPALPDDGDVPYVRADVLTEVGPILVRLAGVTTGPTTPAYAWLADDEPAPAAAVPLVLGRKGPWRLQVDLGRAPDVFTLVGAMEECRRLAAAYARELHAGGIGVAVVGDALGAETFDGCHSLTGLLEGGGSGSGLYVVITAGMPADAAAGIRGLAKATGARCIPVVIGPVPDGRWSAQLGVGD
ncbi:hypothetical protein ACQPYA_14195 [Micromonospora sp. CA-263727]|uniref:hypothetical protein n=1 Tax=Micromonospora sp. CA-263727 TaxID=3239967 RepID=UPI003D8CE5F0